MIGGGGGGGEMSVGHKLVEVDQLSMAQAGKRMWDMSNCTYMASGDRRFSGISFDLYFI